jgi:hypothetical protein
MHDKNLAMLQNDAKQKFKREVKEKHNQPGAYAVMHEDIVWTIAGQVTAPHRGITHGF